MPRKRRNKRQKDSMIALVYTFKDGTCTAFDQYGKEMREYAGKWSDKRDRIMADKPRSAKIYKGKWR